MFEAYTQLYKRKTMSSRMQILTKKGVNLKSFTFKTMEKTFTFKTMEKSLHFDDHGKHVHLEREKKETEFNL